ncbi:MAG: hypothetical protein K0S39_21 [Paenibacillus sp.]|jgi:ubiquinone/menaquinone biosynthesis C-methylase UbiE|nr:hypothetical protein [Paenibacillus sp.]
MNQKDKVEEQYLNSEPLKIRMDTHRLYSEKRMNLDMEAMKLMNLNGSEAILDVGCGPGAFLRFLRDHGHQGRLAGLDRSPAMIAEAEDESIEGFVGDVQQLPFERGTFSRVSARHMLYHVPDISRALEEMKRVLEPGGTVVVSTNSKRSLPGIMDLCSRMLTSFGYPNSGFTTAVPIDTFCIENADEILRPSFSSVREVMLENALVFHKPEPVAQYAGTLFSMMNIPNDGKLYADMQIWLEAEADRTIRSLGGVWRDPKHTAFYVCRIP